MKIAITSDIHYDLIHTQSDMDDFIKFTGSLESKEPEVLIIAGDIVGLGWSKVEECLSQFEKICVERLMVFGNHDYWSADRDTFKHLDILEGKIKNCGFHLLDRNPKIINNIGFAGNCCWYDYSFANTQLSANSSYEKKILNGQVTWNDALFVRLGKTDIEYTTELLQKLENDIMSIEDKVKLIFVVTHHIGFQEMILTKENDTGWNFNNAFQGAKSLGEMLLKHPKIKCHICGHTHSKSQIKICNLLSLNPGSTYQKKRYIIINI